MTGNGRGMMTKLILDLKETTAAQLFRMASGVMTSLIAIWLFSAPFMKAWASEALLQTLREQGIDSQTIASIGRQSQENGRNIERIDKDLDGISARLNTLIQKQADESLSNGETKALVQKLLDLQLRKIEP